MAKERLHRVSRVMPQSELDSVKRAKKECGKKRVFDVLFEAQQYWCAMQKFRDDRERNKRYTYGDQWSDRICVDGVMMSEEEYLMKQGNLPLKNNLIRRTVTQLLGIYRGQAEEPMCTARDRDEQEYGETMTTVLQCNMQNNQMTEINARCMEEFLISGFVVQRKWFGWRDEQLDCWTDYVQPSNFFIDNNMRDFRGWDVSCLGEVHDISFEELCERFAKTPADYKRFAEIYDVARDKRALGMSYEDFGFPLTSNTYYDFLVPFDTSRCRVIEVWRKESKPRLRCHDVNTGDVFKIDPEDYEEFVGSVNRSRLEQARMVGMPEDEVPLVKLIDKMGNEGDGWFMDSYWYYYFLTPFGDILEEGETPYEHKSHPYVFKAYPFIDGEIHSFVSNIIDQQRFVNRLIILYNFLLKATAKGVLLIPDDCLGKYSPDEFAEEWARADGMIIYKPSKSGQVPQQIAANSTNIGIAELLNIQLKFFEDISGVNAAMQGKATYSGMSAALYQQQTQNATTSLLDILDTFASFIVDGANKDVKNMQQYYDTPRVCNISGRNAKFAVYEPGKMANIDFKLSITQSQSTPVYRAIANDMLMEFWKAGAISVQQVLESGTFPFADQLLQSIKSQQEQLAQGKTPDGLSPELAQQVQQGADMQAVGKAEQMMRR